MNQRIQELAEQAAQEIKVEHNNAYWRIQDEIKEDSAWREKFAELIVQECIHVMDATAKEAWDNCTYMREEVPTAAHQIAIRKHFGVE